MKHEVLTNQSLGRELPVDEKQSAATLPVSVSRWPRVQRFVRSFLDNRRHLGIVTALRAAWIVVNA